MNSTEVVAMSEFGHQTQSTFDYTEWQSEHLYNGMTFKEISEHAVKVIEEHFDELPEKIQRDIRGGKK
jgi:hypothetical protein